MKINQLVVYCATLLLATTSVYALAGTDVLPSWNEGKTKSSIIQFVNDVTDINSESFVPQAERIATFDNDGTLWSEQPMYFQVIFALDRVKTMAVEKPEWNTEEPFASILKGNISALNSHDLAKIIEVTHSGMNTETFTQLVSEWINTARHPTTNKKYTEMVFQPMLELLDYLRANGFKTYIVSGGGTNFMRAWVENVYNIPPEQVIGSTVKTEFVIKDGKAIIQRLPEVIVNDDRENKALEIYERIGRRPIASFGNSDGDLAMLQWTTSGEGKRLALYVHHTDEKREWKYDRGSKVGALDKGLDEAKAKNWVIADMKNDWKQIYPTVK